MVEEGSVAAQESQWEGTLQALLANAAAQGRRDGLSSRHLEDVAHNVSTQPDLPPGLQLFLRIALRHCYAAGHRHGADVRRENDRRLARQEPLLASLGT